VPKLRDYLKVLNPYKRQFLVSWVAVLDSVPDLDMLSHLPALLDGLMAMLSDPNREIRSAAHKVLMEFLCEAQASIGEAGEVSGGGAAAGGGGDAATTVAPPGSFDCAAVVDTLVARAQSPDELTRMTALKWLQAFLELAAPRLARSYPAVLGVVLPNVSHPSPEVRAAARSANDAMLALGGGKGGGTASSSSSCSVDTAAVLAVISREVRGAAQEATRLEALRWVHFLLVRNEAEVFGQLALLLSALLDALGAPSERTVLRALAVLGQVAAHPQHFRRVLSALVDRFRGDEGLALLQRGGPLVIRRLCAAMGAARVFGELASLLDEEQSKQGGGDLPFASAMVQALNLVLLTASETRGLRDALRKAGGGGGGSGATDNAAAAADDGAAVFRSLYPAWCHSCGASLSLCLLSQAYGQARAMVEALSSLPLGAAALVELDRLVQLLEAPSFAPLRLGLLEDGGGGPLSRALYALLMVLPQSSAFRTLSSRLSAAAPAARAIGGGAEGTRQQDEEGDGGGDGAWNRRVSPDLLALFVGRQEAHAADEARRRAEAEGLATEEDIRREHREQARAAEAEARAAAAAAATTSGAGGGGGEAVAESVAALTLQQQQS
jgi:vacuole morphology and inheritance protein 14